jgi:hypothetical protein
VTYKRRGGKAPCVLTNVQGRICSFEALLNVCVCVCVCVCVVCIWCVCVCVWCGVCVEGGNILATVSGIFHVTVTAYSLLMTYVCTPTAAGGGGAGRCSVTRKTQVDRVVYSSGLYTVPLLLVRFFCLKLIHINLLFHLQTTYKLRGLSPRENYTDRATAACRRR